MYKSALLLISCVASFSTLAQVDTTLELQSEVNATNTTQYPHMILSDRDRIRYSGVEHSSIWPSNEFVTDASLNNKLSNNRPWYINRLFYSNLIDYKGDDWSVGANPIANVGGGVEFTNNNGLIYRNSRGGHIFGTIGSQFTFETKLIESQFIAVDYLDSYIADTRVVPGEGIARPYSDGAWDHRWSSGNIRYTPSKFFSFSLGQGSFFYGEGYRSLLLSDNALNYPYFRIETTFGPFKYVNLWTQMYDTRSVVNLNPGNRRKYTSTHYLSWNVTERWNLGLYEAVVFGSDTTNGGLDVSYFNPIIMYRPIEDQIDSRTGNALLGMNTSFKIAPNHKVYGQFVLDEFNVEALTSGEGSWLNKFGYQLGYRYDYSEGDVQYSGLVEYNYVRPFVYTHRRVLTNYGHFQQPLAHPLGTNFYELVTRGSYYRGRWGATIHYSIAKKGLGRTDSTGAYYGDGSDIWVSYNSRQGNTGYDTGGGENGVFIQNFRIQLSYTVNPAWRMDAFVLFGYRSGPMYPAVSVLSENPEVQSTTWFSAGLKTNLFRTYYDI